ncbi:AraC family transcriptional regulator [Aquincola tertiaricarbonis]|uniref:AraC family transcriptional regulator n=1 Tax=Aquincola tertiaricarbonis TaxID=391953 RepID=UPI000614D2AF
MVAKHATRTPVKSRAVTPIAFVQALLLAYERYGADPYDVLRKAQITPAMLRRSDSRISAEQMEQVSEAAMRELDDEALGWWQRRLPWGSYGLLARASLTAPDLRVALKRWCRHHRLVCDDVALALEADRQQATITLAEHRPPWPGTRELCLVTTLRNIHGYASWLVDSRIPLRSVQFPFARPAHADAYPWMFGCEPVFDAPVAAFTFDAQYLALPVKRDERAARLMLQRALPLTVRLYRRDRLLVQRVRELLAREPAAMVNADALAAALNVSVRTLHRQLQGEGASLQALKDEARRAHALDLLARTQRPIKQIAQAVGFDSEKSFARAFRGWVGQSPSEWRRAGPSGRG